ncbi:MAG TPA: FtsX-like permease family protein [Anaerolineales bacterium]|nr:FtsX-like permease family protein [Anaerolineales bacterium]
MATEKSVQPNLLKPRWRKVLADLWDNKTRTFLVISSIAVGVFSLGMIISTYIIMDNDVDVAYAAHEPANIDMTTDLFDDDFMEIIARVDGVEAVEGRRILVVQVSNDGQFWQPLNLAAIDDIAHSEMHLLEPMRGQLYPGRREAVVTESLLINAHLEVGDMLEIEIPNGDTYNLSLVGVVNDQVTNVGDVTAVPMLYITRDTLHSLGLTEDFNHLYIQVEGDGSDQAFIDAVADRVQERIERNGRSVYQTKTSLTTEHPFAGTILAVLGVLGALGGLIMILSSSLIVNTLNALLTQHMRQIGIMKLVGGRSRQILGMYMMLIFSYGFIALVTAIPLGGVAGYALARFMAGLMGIQILGFRFVPLAVIIQVVISFVIPLGAGFFPVNKGSKINVRRAISNDRPGTQPRQSALLDRITSFFSWISRPILLSIRNTFRQKARLSLTIFTLTVAGAIFIAVFNVRDSMENMMDLLMAHFTADVTVNFSQPYSISRVTQVLESLPGVDYVEGWGAARGDIWDENDEVVTNINIFAAPADTQLLRVDLVAGRWLNPGEEKAMVISDSILEDFPDLVPGDSLRIKLPGQPDEEWQVVGIFRFVAMVGFPLAYADFDFIASQLHMQGKSVSYRVVTHDHTRDGQVSVKNFVGDYLKDRGFAVSGTASGLQIQEDNTKAVNILIIFLLIMAFLTATVGSIGLTGTMGMNVLERTREIGVMRAIGAVDWEIIKSVVIEGVMIGWITWLFAIVISFPISKALLGIISSAMMGSDMRLVFTPAGIVYWFGVVTVLSVFASMVPARSAARLTINEVLSYE